MNIAVAIKIKTSNSHTETNRLLMTSAILLSIVSRVKATIRIQAIKALYLLVIVEENGVERLAAISDILYIDYISFL